jgi:hypothetical protein
MLNISQIYPKLFNLDLQPKLSNKKICIFTITPQWINYMSLLASILVNRGNSVNFFYSEFQDYDRIIPKKVIKDKLNEIKIVLSNINNKNFSAQIIKEEKNKVKINSKEFKYIKKTTKKDVIRAKKDIYVDISHTDKNLYREILNRNLKCYKFFKSFLKKNKPDIFLIPNGFYYEWGIVYELCKKNNIKIKSLESFNRSNDENLIIQTKQPANIRNVKCIEDLWKNRKKLKHDLDIYKNFEKKNYKRYYTKKSNKNDLIKKLNIELNKINILILPSFPAEQHLTLNHNVFKNQNDWMEKTIKYLSRKKNVNIIFKCHPYAYNNLYRQKETPSNPNNFINKLKKINNLIIIPPNIDINAKSFYEISDIGICYGSFSCLEMASIGKRTIVCTDIFYADKKFSDTPKSKKEYFNLIKNYCSKEIRSLRDDEIKNAQICFSIYMKLFPYKFPYSISQPEFNFKLFPIRSIYSLTSNISDYGKTLCFLEKNKFNKKRIIKKYLSFFFRKKFI